MDRPNYDSIKDEIINLIALFSKKEGMLSDGIEDDPTDYEDLIKDLNEYYFRLSNPKDSFELYNLFVKTLHFYERFCWERNDFFDDLSRKIELLLDNKIKEWVKLNNVTPEFTVGDEVIWNRKYFKPVNGIVVSVNKIEAFYTIWIEGDVELEKTKEEALKLRCGYLVPFEDVEKKKD